MCGVGGESRQRDSIAKDIVASDGGAFWEIFDPFYFFLGDYRCL
jgi:hypothetical protein